MMLSTTPAGILFLLLALFFVLKKKNTFMNLLLLCAVTDLFIEMGFSLIIMGTLFTHYDLCLFYLAFYSISDFYKVPYKLKRNFFTLNFMYIVPIILLLVFPSNILIADSFRVTWDEVLSGAKPVHPAITNRVLKITFEFIFSSFVAINIYTKFSWDDYKYFLIKCSSIINGFLLFGLLEFFVKNVLGYINLWGDITEFFFGITSSTVYEARLRGDSYELNLFTKEASHYAYTLFLCMIIKLTKNIVTGKKNGFSRSILVCVLLMVLSTSFSTVLFLGAFLVIYFIYRWYVLCPSTMRYEKLALILGLMVGSSSVISYISANDDGFVFRRVLNFMDNWQDFFDINNTVTLGDGSTYVRIMSVLQTFYAFWERPLFGYSLGALACHGATAMFLSGIGIIGVFCWIKFYFYTIPLNKVNFAHRNIYIFLIGIYFFINTLNSLGLRPFYDMTLVTIIICFNIILFRELGNKLQSKYE